MKIYQINAADGTAIERDANEQEIAEIELTQRDAQIIKADAITENENKQEIKSSAISKLIDLGLTEDEAKAFLG